MPRKKTPKTYVHYIKSKLREIWGWDNERKKAKRRAWTNQSKYGREEYFCEKCAAQPLSRKEVQIDHIDSVENVGAWDGWDNYIARLFVEADGLEVLCLDCHKEKTKVENAERKRIRKEKI